MHMFGPHRSPPTPTWDRVRELYQEPDPEPREVVGRIIEALGKSGRDQVTDATVVLCLDAVLWGAAMAGDGPDNLPAADLGGGLAAFALAGAIRRLVQHNIVATMSASDLETVALDAATRTVIEAVQPQTSSSKLTRQAVYSRYASYAQDGRLNELATGFFSHYLEELFRYLVNRDLSDFVGLAALPSVQEAQQLVDRVGRFCRERGAGRALHQYEQELQEIVSLSLAQRRQRLGPLVEAAIQSGLADLAGQSVASCVPSYHGTADGTDSVLTARCQRGDKTACNALLERYKSRIYALVRAIGQDEEWTEDVVVEVLVQVYRSLELFRGECSFKTWVYRVTKNVCAMELRKMRSCKPELKNIAASMTNADDPADLALDKYERQEAVQALLRLPNKYGVAVSLYYIGECSYPELAEVLDVPLGTAKTLVFEGLKRIRRTLPTDY